MRKKKSPPPSTGGVWPSLYHEEEPPFTQQGDALVPKGGTVRPHTVLPRPRDRSKPKAEPDFETVQRIAHIEWVRDQIIADVGKRAHWDDPRWDDLPPEWSFENWLALQRRSGKIK